MSRRCVGCMKMKEQSPVCEHCGYNEYVPNESHQLPVGTILQGRYQIGKQLGQGGFGITYIGWDMSLETPVAIKEYYPGSFVSRDCSVTLAVTCSGSNVADLFAHNRDRFLREARILARLSHVPGIVRVQNLFAENNTAYIVMEYVEGIDLKHYIRLQNRVLTVQEAFAVLRPVMYALSKVHEAELVHRDISPDNIMIQRDGSAKLLDFGAAREVENAEVNKDLPQSTEAILKHGFAPIEQYRRRGTLGPWTDVYALCATLYYCLTGKVPADAPERVMGDDNVNWRQIPGLTEQQIQTLEKGLALLPENRIRTMRELHAGLFGQTFTQIKQAEKKPEPVKKPEKKKEPKPEFREQEKKKTDQKPEPNYPVHTVSLESEKTDQIGKEIQKKRPNLVGVLIAVFLMGALILGGVLTTHQNVTPVLRSDWVSQFPYSFKYISSITFLDTLDDAPGNAMDVSESNTGCVKAWVMGNSDLYIGAEGGVYAPADAKNLFADFFEVKTIYFNESFYTENVTNMDYMFCDCKKLINLDLSSFNTSNVNSMSHMFCNCTSLENLEISSFDTSNVTNMSQMFRNCSGLEELNLSSFDTSDVTNMDYMFQSCSDMKNLNLSSFDTSNVTDMAHMFQYCSNLVKLDLSNFNTPNVTSMTYLFHDCSSLEKLEISNFDTSHVTKLDYMFQNCGSLVNLNLSSFDTSNVTTMWHLFDNCSSLEKLDISNFNTGNVTDIEFMFYGCNSLTDLDLTGWDVSNVKQYMKFMDDGKTINGRPWKEFFEN